MGQLTEDIEALKEDVKEKIINVLQTSNDYKTLYETEWEPKNIKDSSYLKNKLIEKIERGIKHDQ